MQHPTVLPSEVGLLFPVIRDHPYDDECCRIQADDGPPRLKPGRAPHLRLDHPACVQHKVKLKAKALLTAARDEFVKLSETG